LITATVASRVIDLHAHAVQRQTGDARRPNWVKPLARVLQNDDRGLVRDPLDVVAVTERFRPKALVTRLAASGRWAALGGGG
jgi:hypothetical protein